MISHFCNRMLLAALVLAAGIAAPAAAQQVVPQLGIDAAGTCRNLSVRDVTKPGADKMVPILCVDTTTHSAVMPSAAITGGTITGITDLAVADGGTGASTLTGYVKGSGTSALTASATIPSSDITGLGTAAAVNTGTSGSTIPLLSGSNVWSSLNTFGNVKLGDSTTVAFGGTTNPLYTQHGTSASGSGLAVVNWAAGTTGPSIYLGKSRGATVGAFDAVQSGDQLGVITFWGTTGTAMARGARIQALAAETFSGSASGSYLSFLANTAGTNSETNPLRIYSDAVRPGSDNATSLGTAANRWSGIYTVRTYYTANVFDAYGAGSPAGVLTADIGSTYRRTDGGAGTSFCVKESGNGTSSGWVCK